MSASVGGALPSEGKGPVFESRRRTIEINDLCRTGSALYRLQERLVGALLCSPGLLAVVPVAGLTRYDFPSYLGDAFAFACKGDRDRTLRLVRQGTGEIARLYRLGGQLTEGQALSYARQIRESVERERAFAPPRPPQPARAQVVPIAAVTPKAPAAAMMKPEPNIAPQGPEANSLITIPKQSGASPAAESITTIPEQSSGKAEVASSMMKLPTEPNVAPQCPAAAAESVTTIPKQSGTMKKADAASFLRDALASGPVGAKELEQRAVEAGLLDAGKSIGDSKRFRKARSALGVKTFQRPGVKSGGWVWALQDQAAVAEGLNNQNSAVSMERPPRAEAAPVEPTPQTPPPAAAMPALPGAEPDAAEWKALKDRVAALFGRFGLMGHIGTVDTWRLQHSFDPGLIWPAIAERLEQQLRMNPLTSLSSCTPMLVRQLTKGSKSPPPPTGGPKGYALLTNNSIPEMVRRDCPPGAAATTAGHDPGKPAVAPPGKSVLTPAKPNLPDRYLKTGKGIVAAEQIPPEDWIILARQYREHGIWPNTLGPPPAKPGSSCPPEFAKEAS